MRPGPIAAISLLAFLTPLITSAQSNIPREETWVTNDSVSAIAVTPETIYLGGSFTYVGPYTGYGVPISIQTGKPAGAYPKVNGPVDGCISDGAGGWFISGSFSRVGDSPCKGIAHIRSDGAMDSAWTASIERLFEPGVRAMALSGATLYLTGNFTAADEHSTRTIVALDAKTGQAMDWNPENDQCSSFATLAISGTTIYTVGVFSGIGVQPQNNLAALDTKTGIVTAWNPCLGVNNEEEYVAILAVSESTLYVAGEFTSFGGQPRMRLAAVDRTTGQLTAWNPQVRGERFTDIRALAVSGSTVYIGGMFTSVGGLERNGVAALDAVTGEPTNWNPNLGRGCRIYSMAVSGSTIYIGGFFWSVGGKKQRFLAAVDASTGLLREWNPNLGCSVNALAVAGDVIYAGGEFSSLGGVTRHHIAALDAATGKATDWNPNANSEVMALTVSGSTVYAGGYFCAIGGQERSGIAALDSATGLAMDWNPNAEYEEKNKKYMTYVNEMAISGNTIYVEGAFSSIGGQPRNHIAALDATTGHALDWKMNSGYISGDFPLFSSIALAGPVIYVGGPFHANGARNLAALDAVTGSVRDWHLELECADPIAPSVRSILLEDSTLYIGGAFTTIGGQKRNSIAAIDTSTKCVMDWNPNPSHESSDYPYGKYKYVKAMAKSGKTIYIGGAFTEIGGQSRNHVGAVDATTGIPTAWNPGAGGDLDSPLCFSQFVQYSGVYVLAASETAVYVGGPAHEIGQIPRPFFAQFDKTEE